MCLLYPEKNNVKCGCRASRRGKKGLNFYRDKNKARTVVGRGEERLLCDPGSELLLGRRDKRRAKIVNGKSKKQKQRGSHGVL